MEIKPKGAVMPVGTLVPPGNNRLKYRVARFDAQQRFKAQGNQSWGSIDRPCLYHPREFYSGEATRAAATLKELMKTPQNKLRAWENGNMLFGAGSGKGQHGEGKPEGGETAGEVELGKAVGTAGLAGGDGCVLYYVDATVSAAFHVGISTGHKSLRVRVADFVAELEEYLALYRWAVSRRLRFLFVLQYSRLGCAGVGRSVGTACGMSTLVTEFFSWMQGHCRMSVA